MTEGISTDACPAIPPQQFAVTAWHRWICIALPLNSRSLWNNIEKAIHMHINNECWHSLSILLKLCTTLRTQHCTPSPKLTVKMHCKHWQLFSPAKKCWFALMLIKCSVWMHLCMFIVNQQEVAAAKTRESARPPFTVWSAASFSDSIPHKKGKQLDIHIYTCVCAKRIQPHIYIYSHIDRYTRMYMHGMMYAFVMPTWCNW